ncbi:MAG: glycosyltransferase [Methyloprofundus sp.]|nr:glycosyltransferase [Methyloprofundus sp.]
MSNDGKKLRIALISNNYTPYSGGVVSSINAQVANLLEDGHLVRVITLDFLGNKHTDPDYVVRIHTPIKFRCRKNHYAIPWFMVTQLKQIITSMNADIIHVHHPFLLGTKGLEVARTLGIPVIFTYHTLYEEYAHYVPLPTTIAKPLIRKLVRNFCCAVDTIIVPSPNIRDYLKEQNIITILQCIPSPLQSFFQGIPYTERTRSAGDPVKLLSVLRFTKEKNVPFLLDVLNLLDERFTLTLVGYGAEYENLRSYAYDHLQLSTQQLQFVLKPPREQLINYYRDADLFLFPSRTDTQGLVMLEAMACSTPAVAVMGPGQRALIQHNKNGVLVTTEQEMQQAITDLANHKEAYYAMQKEAWRTAQSFLPKQFREKLLAVYRQLIDA